MIKRDKSLDLVRCVACILIVVFHFEIDGRPLVSHIESSSVDLGMIAVGAFFILSGASLYISTSKQSHFKIGNYIYKRFLAIYPAFWVAYIIVFLYMFWKNGGIPQDVPKVNILLSVFGMDGMFAYKIPTFYMVGEWYVGTIVIVYCFFPILKWLIDKIPKIAWAIILVVFLIFVFTYSGEMMFLRHPVFQIVEVAFGIYYAKYVVLNENRNTTWRNNKPRIIAFIISIAVIVTFVLVKVDGIVGLSLVVNLVAISTFYFIAQLNFIMKNMAVDKVVTTISKYSYCIFLIHHVVINEVSARFDNAELSNADYLTAVVLCVVLIAVFAFIVKNLSGKLIGLIKMIPKRAEA